MNLSFFKTARHLAAASLMGLALAAAALPPGTDDEILERIRPVGMLNAAEVTAEEEGPRAAYSGEEVYNTYCTACHTSGVSGSPIYGDVDAWSPRIAKGVDVLYASTLNGLNVMPPRGTCPDCTDEELHETVDYMVAGSQ